jgi:glycerol-3-phosphate acyltransferase PlsX
MKIIADAFGGDNAPLEILKGCRGAADEFGFSFTLAGDKSKIESCAAQNGISLAGMDILHSADIIGVEEEPSEILKSKSESSMAVGLKALAAGNGDAFVSAGSTGALIIGATFIVKRSEGIKRPAIGSILPSAKGPVLLLDSGANAECHAENLVQFAQMGDSFMKKAMGMGNPSVRLANIGTEETKGDKLRLEAFKLLKDENIRFDGNIEARDIPFGVCDIVVADGFTGNIILKMYEGVAAMMLSGLKDIYKKNLLSKLSYLMVNKGFSKMRESLDYKNYGGAPILGVKGVVVKAHGSSDARTFKNAVRQAAAAAKQI